ncbi:MAG TPA: sigma-70 family RNA polymerase sigma factor, partial [Polyangiaceae bacterium]
MPKQPQTMPPRNSPAPLSLVVNRDHRSASDGDLARGLMAGDARALAETWRRYAPMVLLLTKRTLGSQSEAEDISQEVFYRLFRKAKHIENPDSLRSFIYAIALHAIKSELYRRKLRSWLFFVPPQALSDRGFKTPDMESRDLIRKFRVLLDRLPTRERLVFVLRRMESMTVEEIAETMKLSESTVKRSMTRASSSLSRWIEADPGLASVFDVERWRR